MAPRLNKRQQRQLEELSALGAASASDDDEQQVVSDTKPRVGFSSSRVLIDDENDDNDDDDDEQDVPAAAKRKKKKSKKKNAIVDTPSPKNEKKAAKRARAKQKKAGNEDLEQALAQLKLATSVPASVGPRPPLPTQNTLHDLLAVSLAHIDPTAEMRRFFGSKVVASAFPSSAPARVRRAAALNKKSFKSKSNLTRPQPGWWSASQREGLSIRELDRSEVGGLERRRGWVTEHECDTGKGGERWWTVEYSRRYKSLTKLFIQAVMSGHPDALWELQRRLPWHADNLLQLAEVYRHREEHAQAVDFVDRALFTYERAFVGAFAFTTGTNRLDFDRVENRPFFLALHRQIADLQRRGCARTAFEFSRLLYALDPHSDPHGAVYHLDLLALKGGMGEWLVDVYAYFDRVREGAQGEGEKSGTRKMDPSLLPGWAYARALVLRVAEGDKASDVSPSAKALEEAIRSFPEVVPLLADKLDVALPGYIRSHESFRVYTDAGTLLAPHAALHALVHMYTAHSSAPWKDPSHPVLPSWLLSTITSLFPTPSSLPPSSLLPTTPRRTALVSLLSNSEVQRTLVRHIMVLEGTHRRLLGFLRSEGESLGVAGGVGLACDPAPPGTCVSRYDGVYFEGVEDVGAVGGAVDEGDERMLEGVIGDPEVRGRVLQFLRGFRAQFPGGLGEMMERIGPEAVEDLLVQVQGVIAGDEDAGGMMPGALAGAGVEGGPAHAREGTPVQEEEGQDEDEGEDEDWQSGIHRMFRSVLGRFWNGAVGIAGDTSSSSDDDDEGMGHERAQAREGGEENNDADLD